FPPEKRSPRAETARFVRGSPVWTGGRGGREVIRVVRELPGTWPCRYYPGKREGPVGRLGRAVLRDLLSCRHVPTPTALAGALVRRSQPLGVLGRAIKPVGGLERLEPALRFGPGRTLQQRGDLLGRQGLERLHHLQVLLQDLQAVDAGDDGR